MAEAAIGSENTPPSPPPPPRPLSDIDLEAVQRLEADLANLREAITGWSDKMIKSVNELISSLDERLAGLAERLRPLAAQQQRLLDLLRRELLRPADQPDQAGASLTPARIQEFLGQLLLLHRQVKGSWDALRRAGAKTCTQAFHPEHGRELLDLQQRLTRLRDLLHQPELLDLAEPAASLREQAFLSLQALLAQMRCFQEGCITKTMKVPISIPLTPESPGLPPEIIQVLSAAPRLLADPLLYFQGIYADITQKYLEPCLQTLPSGGETNLLELRKLTDLG